MNTYAAAAAGAKYTFQRGCKRVECVRAPAVSTFFFFYESRFRRSDLPNRMKIECVRIEMVVATLTAEHYDESIQKAMESEREFD